MIIDISRDMLKFLTKMKCPECKCKDFHMVTGHEDLTIETPEGLYLWCNRCELDYHAPDGLLHKRWKQGQYTG